MKILATVLWIVVGLLAMWSWVEMSRKKRGGVPLELTMLAAITAVAILVVGQLLWGQ